MNGTINLDHPDILNLFSKHREPGRMDSAAFLIWYLENYYRLDEVESVDAVCDQYGDKGVDGIYVNESDATIYIFQTKLVQKVTSKIGDTSLKEFAGTLLQFKNKATIENLLATAGDAEIVKLIKRLDLVNKIETHELKGVFLTNAELDSTGEAYLKGHSQISFIGKTQLLNSYISDKRTTPLQVPKVFDISGFDFSEYVVDSQTKVVIAPIKAQELVKLDGIADQSLFAYNIRGSLGRTQVNKDIVKSIMDRKKHKLFPLFHNGITIICSDVEANENVISLNNYYVVNGCQSLTSLFGNQEYLTGDLRILTKFVQMDVNSELSHEVAVFSNTQNGARPRDFKSNNPFQIRLQNEFKQQYKRQYSFEIKEGEREDSVEEISNEVAGLYFWAFDLKEPWATHRKYQVFDERHEDLFARPEVTAHRIVMCHIMMKCIVEGSAAINNRLFAKYGITRYIILFILRNILEQDKAGKELLRFPEQFVKESSDRRYFEECISRLVNDIIVDINAEVDDHGADFDYRGRVRDETWVKKLSKDVVSNHLKAIRRNRTDSFEIDWLRKPN